MRIIYNIITIIFQGATFEQGLEKIFQSYNLANQNFSNVDVALETLDQGLALGDQQCHHLIQNNPCHSDYSLNLLQKTDNELKKASVFVRQIVEQLLSFFFFILFFNPLNSQYFIYYLNLFLYVLTFIEKF